MKLKKAEPQIVYKGDHTFRHDLFKLKPTLLKKNVSFVRGEVKIETFEHSHFFHTHDSGGRPQKYCTQTGGHFHEMTWHSDEATGKLVAKCGPAMHYIYKRKGRHQKKVMQQIEWNNDNNENSNSESVVKDGHIHDVEYLWSENISADTVRRRQAVHESLAVKEMKEKAEATKLGLEE